MAKTVKSAREPTGAKGARRTGAASTAGSFSERVYDLVRSVPRGRIVSYGAVAAMLGKPRAARAVGQALRSLPDDNDVPWWRVVNRNGAVSSRPVVNARPLQEALLRKERVKFDRQGCADWSRYGWDGSSGVSAAGGSAKAGARRR